MTKSTLAVPTTTSAVFVVLAVAAVTVHVPTSSTINVQFPLASAVPETVLLPFVAVTVAPALVVTTICKSARPRWPAPRSRTHPGTQAVRTCRPSCGWRPQPPSGRRSAARNLLLYPMPSVVSSCPFWQRGKHVLHQRGLIRRRKVIRPLDGRCARRPLRAGIALVALLAA